MMGLGRRLLCTRASWNVPKYGTKIPKRVPKCKARLDYKRIAEDREYFEHVKTNAEERLVRNVDMEKIRELAPKIGHFTLELNQMQAERNVLGKQKPTAESIEKSKQLRTKIKQLSELVDELQAEIEEEGLKLPNLTHEDVPRGVDDSAARVLRKSRMNRIPSFPFPWKDHLELGQQLGILDFFGPARTSGSKFVTLAGDGAILELGLVQWVLHKLRQKGFFPMLTPELVRSNIVEGCGFQPRGTSSQIYRVEHDNQLDADLDHELEDLCLVGTSEITLTGSWAQETISETDLPIRLAGFGHCFRAEAGALGRRDKGLYRLHQFSKVEMVVLCTPEQSEEEHENLCTIQEEICDDLGLHWRTLDMPTGELGASAYRKYDVQVWMPSRGDYGEVASVSNCTDYQSRRLDIRYKPSSNEKKKTSSEFLHTLNGTACAIPRTILAILETHQNQDGSVNIPQVLLPYLPGIGDVLKRPKSESQE